MHRIDNYECRYASSISVWKTTVLTRQHEMNHLRIDTTGICTEIKLRQSSCLDTLFFEMYVVVGIVVCRRRVPFDKKNVLPSWNLWWNSRHLHTAHWRITATHDTCRVTQSHLTQIPSICEHCRNENDPVRARTLWYRKNGKRLYGQ